MIKISGIFTLSMGILMFVVWIVFLVLGQFPELKTVPLEATFLLIAESLTAIALILGGTGILTLKSWGKKLNLTALGMMLYTSIYSIGVFGQEGIIPAVIFFVSLTILTILILIRLIVMGNGANNAHGFSNPRSFVEKDFKKRSSARIKTG